jgi:AcrR family transcriptional regulator
MDVAESHLARQGYMGVSLEAIAGEVGVSKPALYYHFPGGKEQLFVEIAHRSLGRVSAGLESAMASAGSGAGKLGEAARWLMEEGERGHPVNEMRDVARFASEEHRGALAEGFYRSFHGPIHGAIAGAVASGEFRDGDSEAMTWAFLGMISGMLDVQGVPAGGSAKDGALVADEMVWIFLEGALARHGNSVPGGGA